MQFKVPSLNCAKLKVNLGLGKENCQHAGIYMSVSACWLVVLWGQMYVIEKNQHGSRSTRFPFKVYFLIVYVLPLSTVTVLQ